MIENKLGKKYSRKGFLKIILFVFIFSLIVFVIFLAPEKNNLEKIIPEIEKENIPKKEERFLKISKLSLSFAPIKIYGKTTSKSQVSVYVEIPAKVTNIHVGLGDYVNKGDVILTMDSAKEQNNLFSAEYALARSKLSLDKILAGSREEDKQIAELDLNIKKDALKKTQSDINKQISDLKIFLGKTLRQDIDDFFDHTEFDNHSFVTSPVFTYRLRSETVISKLEENREILGKKFKTFTENEINYSDIKKAITISEDFSNMAKLIYDNSKDILGFSDSKIETLEMKTLEIKTSIDKQKEILKNLKNIFNTQNYLLKIAENKLSKIKTASRQEDINLSENAINSAENSVLAAHIALSKKTILAPISGKISNLSADVGKIASPSVSIFSITNPLNLKIESEISVENLQYIFLGKEILINGNKEKISAISPVINSQTGSIAFEANFTEKVEIISGEIVNIVIDTENNKTEKTKEKLKNIALPLSSVFEIDNKYYIYIIGSELKAKKIPVKFIKISGENIIVENTFTGNEKLIINARGISNNDKL